MTTDTIARVRLAGQQLLGTGFRTPQEIVAHFGAMQAQDYAMAKWAVGVRLAIPESAIAQAINDGSIIRTHVLRPTWHLVAAADVRWMLQLTAPHVKKQYLSMCLKFGIDEKVLKGYNKAIEKALKGNKYLTRDELMQRLKLERQYANDFRSALIMMNAEQDGIVCNGPMRDKQFTYALLDERVPPAEELKKEEALARLAGRYFASHGPATLQDFSWWSGLSVANAKLALELVKQSMQSMQVDGLVYWFYDGVLNNAGSSVNVHFLPSFDEYLISYKDRTASIALAHQPRAFTGNGIFKPVIVANGRVVGTWKRTVRKSEVVIETEYFSTIKKGMVKSLTEAAACYAKYLEKNLIIS